MDAISEMHWRRLLAFAAVCDTGGIGQAADRIRRSQPAVSQAIAKLEEVLGSALLDRGRGGSVLTPAGALLHRRLQRMFAQLEHALRALTGTALPPQQIAALYRHLTDTQLRCHLAIAQQGSAMGAAKALGVSQPAVHRAARDLERTVGTVLYQRRIHNVSVTKQGGVFALQIGRALRELEQAREEIAGLIVMDDRQGSGNVALGVLPMCPPRLIAKASRRLLLRFPRARLTVREGDYQHLLDALRYGEVDVIVGALRGSPPESDVIESPLFDDPYVIAMRGGHPLSREAQPYYRDLARYDWVVPPSGMPRRVVLERVWDHIRASETDSARPPFAPAIVTETSSLAIMVGMLLESDALTLLSRSQIAQDDRRDRLMALALPDFGASRKVGVTTRDDWLPTATQTAFMAALRSAATESARHQQVSATLRQRERP